MGYVTSRDILILDRLNQIVADWRSDNESNRRFTLAVAEESRRREIFAGVEAQGHCADEIEALIEEFRN